MNKKWSLIGLHVLIVSSCLAPDAYNSYSHPSPSGNNGNYSHSQIYNNPFLEPESLLYYAAPHARYLRNRRQEQEQESQRRSKPRLSNLKGSRKEASKPHTN
ncbi:MAG: hypothetical protein WBQ73_03865 [Candidatus Babeliales bacterium]